MKKVFLSLIILIAVSVATVSGVDVTYDAIVVRSDLPYDWAVAQAYSQQAKIPIITTSPDALDKSAGEQLLGFNEAGHTNILVFGGEEAISPNVEAEMVDLGFITHRIREVDRYGTSSRVAVELYEGADTVVVVNGEGVEGLLNAQVMAFQTGAPIIFLKENTIPPSVKEALRLLETEEIILIPDGISTEVREELRAEFKLSVFSEGFSGVSADKIRVLDIALGLAFGTIIALLLRLRRRKEVPYRVLTEDEEKIIRAVEGGGGEIKQDVLYEETGFSRPKISRLVSDLVKRNLLEKTPFKRTFKLKIKKEFSKS